MLNWTRDNIYVLIYQQFLSVKSLVCDMTSRGPYILLITRSYLETKKKGYYPIRMTTNMAFSRSTLEKNCTATTLEEVCVFWC